MAYTHRDWNLASSLSPAELGELMYLADFVGRRAAKDRLHELKQVSTEPAIEACLKRARLMHAGGVAGQDEPAKATLRACYAERASRVLDTPVEPWPGALTPPIWLLARPLTPPGTSPPALAYLMHTRSPRWLAEIVRRDREPGSQPWAAVDTTPEGTRYLANVRPLEPTSHARLVASLADGAEALRSGRAEALRSGRAE
jgi:hypothetical protein